MDYRRTFGIWSSPATDRNFLLRHRLLNGQPTQREQGNVYVARALAERSLVSRLRIKTRGTVQLLLCWSPCCRAALCTGQIYRCGLPTVLISKHLYTAQHLKTTHAV
jgi:hypothetical protein